MSLNQKVSLVHIGLMKTATASMERLGVKDPVHLANAFLSQIKYFYSNVLKDSYFQGYRDLYVE